MSLDKRGVLENSSRLEIYERALDLGSFTRKDIASEVDLSETSISSHLDKLVKYDLLIRKRENNHFEYSTPENGTINLEVIEDGEKSKIIDYIGEGKHELDDIKENIDIPLPSTLERNMIDLLLDDIIEENGTYELTTKGLFLYNKLKN